MKTFLPHKAMPLNGCLQTEPVFNRSPAERNPGQVLGALYQNLAVCKLRGEFLCPFETFSTLFIMT